MKLSEQWLREWANPQGDTASLTEQLTMAGLEVDSVKAAGSPLPKVVVGQVTEISAHPNADKLQLCVVDVGSGDALNIVCGASNVTTGGHYPVALIGAELPGGLKIKRSKLRGEESHGMLCSAVELGIADTAQGLLELDAAAKPGMDIAEHLGLDDQIIDLDLTPNRADCFSVLGVGRDIAAVNDSAFREPDIAAVSPSIDAELAIGLDAKDACAVFAGRVIKNINPEAQTPVWMVEKLRRSGVRALHPVVDVTNFVMLELGQPMHGYDLAKLDGKISARWAKSDETIRLLDEQEVKLSDDVLVIANAGCPVAIAGIMGGAATAVSSATRDVFLESAWFSPAALAGRARRYGLHTEASLRFERGVDFTGQLRAIERATELLLEIVGGEAGPAIEQRTSKYLPKRAAILLRKDRLTRVMGLELPDAEVTGMLKRLGFAVAKHRTGWQVTPTSFRFDIAIEADLIEEVIRLYGYGAIPEQPEQMTAQLAQVSESRITVQRACDVLVDRGYHEVITYSFVDPERQSRLLGEADELTLTNPLSRELSVMRRSLWTGLLDTLSLNVKRQQPRVRIFESGVTFTQQADVIKEEIKIAGLAWGSLLPENWEGNPKRADLFNIKSDIEALLALTGRKNQFEFVAADHPSLCPGRSARIVIGAATVGWLGELHPAVSRFWELDQAPVLFELATEPSLLAQIPAYQEISRFPAVRRDLALLVDENLPTADLVSATREASGALLRDVNVFDIFTGKGIETGLKSVALGLILQETSRTLTELEIEEVINAVKAHLSSKFNASIRE